MSAIRKMVSVCVCTFKRPELLETLLLKLDGQEHGDHFHFEVVITDNDEKQSGFSVVEKVKTMIQVPISYFHEPERSISLARNKCIKEAKGDYIAFIDDDEYPKEDWLEQLVNAIEKFGADGILGPVKPHIDEDLPQWLIKSGLIVRKSFQTGHLITQSRNTRTGNALLKKNLFDGDETPFDPKFGKIGGGDVDFFYRKMGLGKKLMWCDEAVVYEIVSPDRRFKNYYLKRSFTRGVTNAWKLPFFSVSTLKSVIAIPIYIAILPVAALVGLHALMKYTVKLCDHLGKMIGYLGIKVVKERPYQN